ncbi:hypothetical protein M413DRAFT_88324 [Hebeloma cylindrosporum]|uniref:Transcriptional regulatory protein n=1 Tax=Hebeloma cylindrosporum TaxID=76867 RepID=A0A0C2YGM6_HEBCY|nr:hypothetical protein M413DRAFT_88324 [Hebeloma cylindrosporum h7]
MHIASLRSSFRISPFVARRCLFTQPPTQAGHNKWSKIKDKKAAHDAQKSVLYARMNNEIIVAAKKGGSADPEKNVLLANALKKAKEQGVPKENIAKSLARCIGGERSGERFTYEALAFNSVGIIIECITNNANRTIHNVREVLTKHSAHMTPVNYLFHRHGCVTVSLEQGLDFDSPTVSKFIDLASEQGAIDFEEARTSSEEHQQYLFYCPPQQLASFEEALSNFGSGIEVESAEIAYIPSDRTQGLESEVEQQVKELVQDLEEIDDTLRVWTTLDFTST